MKIDFLSLNDNLGHQNLAVKLMAAKGWIDFKTFRDLERCLAKLQDFNDSMTSRNNGIEILDTNNLGDVQEAERWKELNKLDFNDYTEERA